MDGVTRLGPRLVIANIGMKGIETRLLRGVFAFGTSLAAIVALRALQMPAWVFAALIVPFFGAFNLAYQGLFKT